MDEKIASRQDIDILEEVRDTIAARQVSYGSPVDFWSAMGKRLGVPASKAILIMMEMKLQRLWTSHSTAAAKESLIDLIGYAYILSLFTPKADKDV